MNPEFQELKELLQKTYESAEKTRKYFLWTLIISLVLFILPLIVFMVVLPAFIGNLTSGL